MSYTESTTRSVRIQHAEDDERKTRGRHGKHPFTVNLRRKAHKGARRMANMLMHNATRLDDPNELDIAPAYRQGPGRTAMLIQ